DRRSAPRNGLSVSPRNVSKIGVNSPRPALLRRRLSATGRTRQTIVAKTEPTCFSKEAGKCLGLERPGPAVAAARAHEPLRPPALEEVLRARVLGRKAILE